MSIVFLLKIINFLSRKRKEILPCADADCIGARLNNVMHSNRASFPHIGKIVVDEGCTTDGA